ncbi:nuclear transport factor 2 family protein [Novosphingobium aquae]|uniref:Nuclear transport factor 2 family protein n=1 Tax=Novosphingobium aquae TaxID=3133435 RepID=A0ABU8S4L4_9SPHN
MSDTVKTLAAKAEIADLVHTYALNIRRGRPEACGALFTHDATFEVRDADPLHPEAAVQRYRKVGREEVAASIGSSGAASRVFPAIHNLIVIVDGERTSATSLMIATVFPTGSELIGDYEDTFRREDGEWRFSSRIYTIYRSP